MRRAHLALHHRRVSVDPADGDRIAIIEREPQTDSTLSFVVASYGSNDKRKSALGEMQITVLGFVAVFVTAEFLTFAAETFVNSEPDRLSIFPTTLRFPANVSRRSIYIYIYIYIYILRAFISYLDVSRYATARAAFARDSRLAEE